MDRLEAMRILLAAVDTGSLSAASRQVTLLTAGNARPWQEGFMKWDADLLRAESEQRRAMLDDLQSRVAKLIHWWHEAQRQPHWYFARTSWKAVRTSKRTEDAQGDASSPEAGDLANLKAIQQTWSGFEERGEREYGPGYNRMLTGDVAFDADSPELEQLLGFARDLHATISFHQELQP